MSLVLKIPPNRWTVRLSTFLSDEQLENITLQVFRRVYHTGEMNVKIIELSKQIDIYQHNKKLHRPTKYNWINYNSIHIFSKIWLIGPCSTIHSSYNISYYEESSLNSCFKKVQAFIGHKTERTKPLFFHAPQSCQKNLKEPKIIAFDL